MTFLKRGIKENGSPVRVILADMDDKLLEDIVRKALSGERGMQPEKGMASLYELKREPPEPSAVVVIEADPAGFATACEMLPEARLVAISHKWRQAIVRFSEMSEESVRDAIRFAAGAGHQPVVPAGRTPSRESRDAGQQVTRVASEPAPQEQKKATPAKGSWLNWKPKPRDE